MIGNLVTVFNGVQGREERRLEVFFERGALELTTDFIVGAPEDSLLIQRPGEPAERFDMAALRREHFAAQGVDPDRAVWVYQYFAHRAFAALARRRRALTRFRRRAPRPRARRSRLPLLRQRPTRAARPLLA